MEDMRVEGTEAVEYTTGDGSKEDMIYCNAEFDVKIFRICEYEIANL